MRKQKGYLYRKGSSWYLRYYDNLVQPDGSIARRQVAKRIAPYPGLHKEYRSKDSVLLKELVDEFLYKLNSGRLQPESTMSLEQFWDALYWPHVQRQKRPSTARSYKQTWNDYVAAHCREIRLRDFRCFDGERILAEIDQRHQLTHSSLKRVKSLLSGMFKHAKRKGILDGINPMQDVSIPQGKESKETHAHSLEEITRMLAVLPEPASTVVATAAFTGLGLSELRGLEWPHYDGSQINVCQSVWEGNIGTGTRLHRTDPKTSKRKAPVPVIGFLAKKLDAYRLSLGNPESGWVFPSLKTGRPLNFNNLVRRAIKPALESVGLEWHGWHAFRRGLATNLYRIGVADKTVQAILRHANVSTTMEHYVKAVDEDAVRAMQALEKQVLSRLTVQ
jgi:integrase